MPIRVFYQNDPVQPCTIRPTPLVSIATSILQNGAGEAFGVTYNLTLTGTLLADQGSPYGLKQDGSLYDFYGTAPATMVGPYGAFDSTVSHFNGNHPPTQKIDNIAASNSIFNKQKALRALFAQAGQRLEITDFNDDEATIICFPRNAQLSFQEGIYVEKCDYTITMECDTLLNKNFDVDIDGTLIADLSTHAGVSEEMLLNQLNGAFISNYNDEWAIEADEGTGESPTLPRSYRITHSINATGKTHFTPSGEKLHAWEQARKFVQLRLANNVNSYPNIVGQIGSGTLNLINAYGGFNHVRSEQISESNGTYGISETWLIASGSAYENFNLSVNSSTDNPYVSVSLDGNIRGLSRISPSGFGGLDLGLAASAYENAMTKYHYVSNSGQFGVGSQFFKRASNAVAVQLNSQPKVITIGANEYTGEVNYNIQFDNRPTNIISGALFENITVTDQYPGDVFAVIPVIGRPTGPILQYIGARTEYSRDISINVTLDYTRVPYGSGRNTLLLKKPSVIEPTATQIANLIRELSPANEPGIRKYFLKPGPQENWSPKEGTWSLSMGWVYELSL